MMEVKFCTHSVMELQACTCCFDSGSAAVLHIGNFKKKVKFKFELPIKHREVPANMALKM